MRKRLGAVMSIVLAATLVPPAALSNPRPEPVTRLVPRTLARSIHLGPAGRERFAFAPTHVAFSWRGGEDASVRYRLRLPAGRVTRWRKAPIAHDLEHGDHHYSAVIAVARPLRIEYRSRAARDVTLDYLNTLDGPVVETTSSAQTADSPNIVTRAQWGANESIKRTSGSCTRRFFKVQQLFVHHTAGTNFDSHPKATMRAIYWYHTVRRGWCDIGYNFVISWDGRVFEGRWARNYKPWEIHSGEDRRGRGVTGAHVAGFNSGSVGISAMGNFSRIKAPPAVRRGLAELLAWEADRHDLPPKQSHTYRNPETGQRRRLPYIAGHRDAGFTECPGNFLYQALADVRNDTKAAMGAGKLTTTVAFAADQSPVTFGQTATFSGSLNDEGGAPVPGQQITVYVKKALGDWRVDATTITQVDGSFTYSIPASKNMRAVAVYFGDDVRWGSQSASTTVKVAPEITLQAEGGTPDLTGALHYPADTDSVPLSGSVVPAHAGHEVVVRVYEEHLGSPMTQEFEDFVTLDTTGSFETEWPVPEGAAGRRFRAVAIFLRDRDHARAKSPPVTIVFDP